MAVSEQTPYIEYTANGTTTSFALEFDCENQNHLIVLVDDVEPVVGAWSFSNGAVVFNTAPENGKKITLQRNTPFSRTTDYQSYNNSFRPPAVNKDFDWIWLKLQELGVADWILSNRIDALKNYVDDRDDELRAYLMEEIRKQGVALDQLEDYYNYLMQRLAQIAIDRGWEASFVVDASGKTQQEINDTNKSTLERIVYIEDFGANKTDFNPSAAEAAAKAVASPNAKPYIGARQTALPMQTLKVWNYLDGYKDRGAVMSIANVDAFDSVEPTTQVLGLQSAAGLSTYPDRDVVGLFVQAEGQPALLTSVNTTFTATTVTCTDLTVDLQSKVRAGQIIDVKNGTTEWSGIVSAINGQTVTVDTAWYIKSGAGATGTPPNGSQAKFVPNTKVWATNFNVMLKSTSDATSMVGIELGLFNNKINAPTGYGYDVWSGGDYPIGAAFQARGKVTTGVSIDAVGTQFGYVIKNASVHGLYSLDSNVGSLMQGGVVSYVAKAPTSYAFQTQNSAGSFLSGINKDGQQEALKYASSVIEINGTIGQFSVMNFVAPSGASQSINLPAASTNSNRVIYVKNLSASNSVTLNGSIEGGGGYVLAARETVQLFCDGSSWYPISEHIF